MAKKPSAEIEYKLKIIEALLALGNNLIRWGGLVLIARYAYLAIESLAGQDTFAGLFVNLLGNFDVSIGLSWGVGLVGFVYGVKQRTLRKDTIERLQGRIITLEKQKDPRRSSSNLTVRGNTRPEDVS